MASQTIQGWHPNPQLMQPPNQAPPPQGWTGSWPPGGNVAFPPGYPGPPPIPGGAAAHPRWNAGYWQYNPLANMQNAQQPWAPGVGWFPPNFNPYKRIPKPPSPSYWNTKLSENGLGLEGMVKRKDPSEYNGEEPHTPWIWNPPSLLESRDRATPTRDFNPRRAGSVDNSLHAASTPTREHGQSRRGSTQEGSSEQTHSQTPERKSTSRTNYIYSSHESSSTHTTPARHSSDPSDLRPSAHSGSSSSGQRSIGHSDSWPNRSRSQPLAANEVPPYPAPTPTILHTRSASTSQSPLTQEPETFTAKVELHPTFSANIIRTPNHYQPRRSAEELPSMYHSRSPTSTGHSSTPSRGPPVPEPLTRQSSLPTTSSTRDVYAAFSEDLSASLTASTSSRSRSSAGPNPLSRSRTEPVVANLGTIPESSSSLSSGEMYLAPLRDTPISSSPESSPNPRETRNRRSSPYRSVPHSPEPSPGLYRDHRPSPYAARHSHPRSHSPSPLASPHPYGNTSANTSGSGGSGPRRENPLPPPPVDRTSIEVSRPPAQEPSPTRYSRKLRVGLWNRRGDHLTPGSYVVYAPENRAYPDELRDYPDERTGYQDEFGSFVSWREERLELPSSLPYHGRPPVHPYESFVVYTYQ